eukprot:m.20832 g.20832  ORF g.20832 m.20832 type:complete len:329 (+) comp7931_c0_seq1:30-1016(+)
MASERIVPLALPKSTKRCCELCGQAAHSECAQCKVTYWCSPEHERLDREGIHWRICEFLGGLRRPFSGVGTQQDRDLHREKQQQRKEHLLRLTLTEAQKLFNQDKFELSVPAAMQALKFGQDAFGLAHVALVTPYLLMGCASIGTGDLRQAESYLSQASWIIVKTPDCSPTLRSQLYRALGRLYHAKRNGPAALKLISDDIYHTSLASGPLSIAAAGGYQLLATVFAGDNLHDQARAAFRTVVQIWRAHFEGTNSSLDEAQECEAVQHLTHIISSPSCADTPLPNEAAYALAMLFHAAHNDEATQKWLARAREGAPESLLKDIERLAV